MIGALIGDVIGSVYEFCGIKTKDFPLFHAGGSFTDDSVMTLAVAGAIMECGGTDGLSAAAVTWMQMLGRRYPNRGYGGSFAFWLSDPDPRPYGSCGNGAAMRVSACGWAAKSLDEARALSYAVTSVTHNHPEGIKGAEATAVAIFLARSGKRKSEIADHLRKYYYPLDFTLDAIRPSYEFDETCQCTVPQAMESFLEGNSYEETVRLAVSLGGDADTLAAIAGSVAEAYYGIPRDIEERGLSYFKNCPDLLSIVDSFRRRYQ